MSQIKLNDLFLNSNNNNPLNFSGLVNNQNNPIINNISSVNCYNNDTNENFAKPSNVNFNPINNKTSLYNNPVTLSNPSFGNFDTVLRQNNFETRCNSIMNSSINKSTISNDESFNKEFKNPNPNKIQGRPFVTNTAIPVNCNSGSSANDSKDNDFLNKMRRRSIKNNKIVFVHSTKAAARVVANEAKVILIYKNLKSNFIFSYVYLIDYKKKFSSFFLISLILNSIIN